MFDIPPNTIGVASAAGRVEMTDTAIIAEDAERTSVGRYGPNRVELMGRNRISLHQVDQITYPADYFDNARWFDMNSTQFREISGLTNDELWATMARWDGTSPRSVAASMLEGNLKASKGRRAGLRPSPVARLPLCSLPLLLLLLSSPLSSLPQLDSLSETPHQFTGSPDEIRNFFYEY
jgi:hypothetical protein